MSRDCVFCRIVAGELPASVVHRDELCWAFLDIRPVRPGHTLVVPVAHAVELGELPAATRDHLWRVGQTVAGRIVAALPDTASRHWLVNDGRATGQSVPHAHLHLVPRRRGDVLPFAAGLLGNLAGLLLPLPVSARRRRRLDQMAATIRGAEGPVDGSR